MKKYFVLILLPCFTLVTAQHTDSVDAVIARQMASQKFAGLSIGIIKEGKVFMTKGYGKANLELDVPASEKTIYKIGSISKQLIATAIMKMVQQGKLALTDHVSKFYLDAPETWKEITIRHLLNHTSGLMRESPAFDPWKIQPDSMLIKAAYSQKLIFPTGSKWEYCNLGYFMLADIIRKLSGISFENYMQDSVFIPAGLTKTRVTSTIRLMPYRADGYMRKQGDVTERAEDWRALRPSGAFVSDITDMMKWELALQQGLILKKPLAQAMWTDTVSTTRSHPGSASAPYGYGWSTAIYKGERVVYHGGSLPGFRSIYYRFPEKNTAIIIFVNSEPADLTSVALEIYEKINQGKK